MPTLFKRKTLQRSTLSILLHLYASALIIFLAVIFFFVEKNFFIPTVVICLALAYFFLLRAFTKPLTIIPGNPSYFTPELLFLIF